MRSVSMALRTFFLVFAMVSVAACGASDEGTGGAGTEGSGVAGAGTGGSLGADAMGGGADTASTENTSGPIGDEGSCTPDCAGKTCGDDGCGGACGTCGEGTLCSAAGVCLSAAECTDTCASTEWVCGTVCGEACGVCNAAESCIQGACVCVPDCTGKTCGDNGCGGTCGTCTAPQTCNEGACADPAVGPEAVCGDGVCEGTESTLTCQVDCGEQQSTATYYCYQVLNDCVPANCSNTQDQACISGALQTCMAATTTAEEATYFNDWFTCLQTCMSGAGGANASQEAILDCYMYGCPDETAACHAGGTYGTGDCVALGQCANCANTTGNTDCWRPCFEAATADATNKFMAMQLCISDACATAANQQACINEAVAAGGACADAYGACPYAGEACTPDCEGKVCGDDGCGGTCGPCGAPNTCEAGVCDGPAECGDGECNGAETCDSCDADCGECVGYYCFELNACIMMGCENAQSEQEAMACQQANLSTCETQALTATEWSNWYSWQMCLATCIQGGTPQAECLASGCPSEMATCFSGGTYGEASCTEVDACVNQNCASVPADEVSDCTRECFETGTPEAIEQQVAILACASGACMTAADQEACLQAATSPAGACADEVAACTSN